MKVLDRLCAGILFFLAVVECWLVPRTYAGRIWILGTDLALFFTAMLNVLRIRNRYAMSGLKLSCITANVLMLVFAAALMASIGAATTVRHPQLLLIAALLSAETIFSFEKNV
jgi:hypothetical protein